MKRAIVFLVGSLCTMFIVSVLMAPQTRMSHQGSSAFQMALDQAVGRLEGGGKMLLAGTATPLAAAPQQPTFDGRYTCDTYEMGFPTCDALDPLCIPHTADPVGHTCGGGFPNYTCELATCDTYDPLQMTCDPNNAACNVPHTTEPAPFNHTCEGYTCDGNWTCDFTVDPRAQTCDAADPLCEDFTFNAFQTTCDPMRPECRANNPKGYCTAQNYPTCDGVSPTCDYSDPTCWVPTNKTSWGMLKARYLR